ncbi:hypothetical protein LSH36_340g00013 [Paralvinella palmiformis]|uniref:Uncharacterized protein n=1 Tax=Paralvinella palmiformis TaxID=53620 RepID=A0AAD9N0B6_9ANNE|nr:hypothetical protein LSH36_340g00013 [Paralvinella palmiformis]
MPSHSTGTGDMPINECENCHNRLERMRSAAVNTDRILMKSVGVGYQSIREVGHISEATSDVYVSKLSPKSRDQAVSAADNDVSSYQQESSTVKTVTTSAGQSLGNEKGGNVVIERTIIRGGAGGGGAGVMTDVQRLSGTSDDFEARLGRISSKNVTTEEMMLGGEETSTTGFDREVTITSSSRSKSMGSSGLHGRSVIVERDGAAGSSHGGAVVIEESHESIRGRPMQIVRHIETSYVGGHPVNKTSRVVVHGKEDQHQAEAFHEFQESSSSGQTSLGTLSLDGMGMTESSSSGQTSSGKLSLGGMGGMTESSSSGQTSSGTLSLGGMGGMTESSSSGQTSSGKLSVGGMSGMTESSSSGQTLSGTLSLGGMGGMTESSSSCQTSSGTLSLGGMGGMTESSSSGQTSLGTLSLDGMGMTRHLTQGFALNEGHVQSGNVEYTSSIQPRTKGRKVVITETRIERKLTGRPGRTVTTTTTTTESSDNNGALRSIMKQPGNELGDLKTKKEISFSEDVIGGYVSTSSDDDDVQEHAREGDGEQAEDGGSESEGSQSSISFDEGSYDGRAGKIVYSCKDDEAIAQGVPGARMYEENITESYELDAEVASSCQIYAQWLDDSTQITTKQLNSALALIQHEWFKVSSTKTSNPATVEGFLTCLNDFSSELMQHVVNLADANGNTALHYAVSHCNMEIVNLLLDTQSIDVNKQNKAGYTAIMLASLAQVTTDRQREIISKMFSMGDVNARASQAGQTALMLAVSHGRQNMVQMLLEAGAKVNMQDEDGSTALMCASEHGHTDIVKMLLGQPDCDPTIQDNDGSTALSIAMEAGHRDIGVLLYAHVNFKQGSPETEMELSGYNM